MDVGGSVVNSGEFESHLLYSCQQLLLQRIKFVPASSPDNHLEQLKAKYKPLNTAKCKKKKKLAKMLQTNKPTEETDSAEPQSSNDEPFLTPKVILFNKADLVLCWNDIRNVGPGLVNLGNTCFLNSVIQCLTYTPPLANYLLSGEHKKNCQNSINGTCALCQLQDHVSRVFKQSGGSVKPAPIIQHLKSMTKLFRIGRQEDAHEFLRYYVDSMQKACLKDLPAKLDQYSKATTLVHQLFGGYFRSQVQCQKCFNTSDTYDPLLDISVETKNCPTLGKALKKITKPDMLDGDNKYSCPKCKTMTVAQKRFTLHSLPTVLTIQLKRFNYNNFYGTKIGKHVSYPEYINLRPYMSETQGPEEWYHLYAVLVHSGVSCHSGHYYCFVLNSNSAWYCMNDTHVSQVRLDTVLSQEAYLLFYIKDPTYRSSPTSYTCTMVTEPAESSQTKAAARTLNSSKASGSGSGATDSKSSSKPFGDDRCKLRRIPKLIIRKRPINKMVPTDVNMDDEATTPPSLPKMSSNSSTLFKPRSVYTAKPSAAVPPQDDKLESVTRKSSSPVSPSQPVMKNKSILDFLVLTNSKDASVQVGESSAPPEQLKKVAKVTPITKSPPASKPIARVSPHPQKISSPPQPTILNTAEEIKAKGNSPRNVVKDSWRAMSPPVEPRRPVPQDSTPISVPSTTPTAAKSPTCSSVPNVLPTMAASPTPVVASPTATRSPKLEHSPVITHSPAPIHSPSPVVSPQVPTFSPQLPKASGMLFNTEHSSTMSTVGGTPGTPATDSELVKTEKKKHKKKKRHHSQTEESSQDDNVSEQKLKKKKLKKIRKEQRDSSEEWRKKKKAKYSSSNIEGIWVEKEISPTPKAAIAPTKVLSPPPQRAPPTNVVSPAVRSIPIVINSTISKPVEEHVQSIPCSEEPKSPKHKTHSKVVKRKNIFSAEEAENKLRPFLLSYYSSSDSACSSPPNMEGEPEPDDTKVLPPSTDDVFFKEQPATVHKTSDAKQAAPNTDVHHAEKNIDSCKREKSPKKRESSSNTSQDSNSNSCAADDNINVKHHHKTLLARHNSRGDGKDVRWDKKSTAHKESSSKRRDSSFDDHGRQETKPLKKHSSSSSKAEDKHEGRRDSHRRHNSDSDHHRRSSDITEARSHRHVSDSDRRDSITEKFERDSSSDRYEGRSKKWDGRRQDDVVKHLTSHQHHQLGEKVRSWSGEANAIDSSVSTGTKRTRDDWDQEFDAGHVKKVRKHSERDNFNSKHNPFQQCQANRRRDNYGRNNYHPNHNWQHRRRQFNPHHWRRSHEAYKRHRH